MREWKRLDRRSRPIANVPVVGIQRKGVLSLNQGAYEALHEPEAVEVLYNEDDLVIGLRPATPSAATYPVRKQNPNSKTYLVAAKNVSEVLNLDTTTAHRYDAVMEDDVLVIDLRQRGVESNWPQRQQNPTDHAKSA